MSINELLKFTIELAAVSRAAILPYFAKPDLEVQLKSDHSPVTVADRATEEALRKVIKKHYPSHGIVGEEFGADNDDAEYVWYLDPIDGTKSFVRGCPLFGTLIALTRNGEPIIGCIDHPALNLLCLGDGSTTTVNGRAVAVRECNALGEALLLTSDLTMISRHQDFSKYLQLIDSVQIFRTWGDCYGYTLLASGFADVMTDPIMNPWDLMALIPIVKGAGGVITSWDGGDAVSGTSIIAASPKLHRQVLAALT